MSAGALRPAAAVRVGAQATAAAVGAKFGFDFGMQIGGVPMALLMGANAAVFAWLMVAAGVDLLLRFKRS